MSMLLTVSDWTTTLSLIFGGCCSNAITLEQLTSQHPNAGSLITFFQFLLISLHGLPKHLTWTRYGPRFRPRRIPLTSYLLQVALFYVSSLLNNAAFAYRIPMTVHIIFRSGGLIVGMLLGWLVAGKRYTLTQITSVLLVTLGVVLTTLSASPSPSPHTSPTSHSTLADTYTYASGIAILTLALLLSGFLGLVQDWTYARYGRPSLTPSPTNHPTKPGQPTTPTSPAWQESMFYLHFLALPMFFFLRHDLFSQIATVNSSPRLSLSLPFSLPFALALPLPSQTSPHLPQPLFSITPHPNATSPHAHTQQLTLSLPAPYLPLLLNTLTQLLCVAGVHRLTSRVAALSVTLVLVVRKAVSLVVSVVGIGLSGAGKVGGAAGKGKEQVDVRMMWVGAGLVLAGTVGYSVGSGRRREEEKGKKQ